ncbi:MAG: hypothetical protein IJ766_08555 [Clostridia bacterium]|nr:hypothetical protein [Clostridia bacterium]
MRYYIGIDGGGTKTEIALFDENKNVIDTVRVAGSNHENLAGSFAEAADILMSGMNLLLAANELKYGDIAGILMGLAGIDHPHQHDALAKILADRGLRNFRIYNDGFIVAKAGLPGGVGIGYNCGTGTCCNSIDDNGSMLQIGGFGDLSADKGNGRWIARRVYNKIYDDVCLGLTGTMMTETFCNRAEISRSRDAIVSAVSNFDDAETAEDFIRLLIDLFFEALSAGDPTAREICEEMAERGAEYICAHLQTQQFAADAVYVVLSGSIHTKLPSDLYIAALEAHCRARTDKTLRFIKLEQPPVMGCIHWLLERG